MLPPDYHSHTQLCKHAQGKPIDYLRVAGIRQVQELASTDHCPTPDGFDLEHRMELAEFDVYATWVREARESGEDSHLLFGLEVDYYEGCTEFLDPFLKKQPLDVVLGSVHYLDYWAFDHPDQRTLWDSVDVASVWEQYFSHIGDMADTGLYDVASHLDLPKKFGRILPDPQLKEYALPALDRIARAGMAIEINTSGAIHDVQKFYPSIQILTWAKERDIPLSFGSDAHSPDRVGADFETAVIMAKQVGYTHSVKFRQRTRELIPLG